MERGVEVGSAYRTVSLEGWGYRWPAILGEVELGGGKNGAVGSTDMGEREVVRKEQTNLLNNNPWRTKNEVYPLQY